MVTAETLDVVDQELQEVPVPQAESDEARDGEVMVRLYHGAPKNARKRIKREGPRRYSWFSTSKRDASEFGKIKSRERDVWEVRVSKKRLDKDAWKLGRKRGDWYKFHKKPPRAELVKTYGKKKKKRGQGGFLNLPRL